MAVLKVTEQATEVKQIETRETVVEEYKSPAPGVQPIVHPIAATVGYEITAARLEVVSGPAGKDLKVTVSPNRRSVVLTGLLARAKGAPAPRLMVRVVLTQE